MPGHEGLESRLKTRLRIGIDGTSLASRRGYGRFLRELLPALLADPGPHEYVLFMDEATARNSEPPYMPIQRPRTIVTVSEVARRRIAEVFEISSGRIFVTPEAPCPTFAPVPDATARTSAR